ncbi:DUF3071 domain-containing protein [Epidermidibacterium keratini]|uniref:DUF3071 domain-containing protein n=1 Tax=Epidermidibacterium keratini TaxID=1891644 RepID=A0A7L4YPD4_9ACTN|nr:septation protein SepH [Epidermidibacterium keratini]QHC01151.1 DUF3071 domain-containing protein [Epidermidibacterium keratini]
MRPLRFVALSEDGTQLVLAPDVPEAIDSGERFILTVDDRLRAAARGDLTRMGQIELEIESQLRPREIQARIRAGETPDSVAAAAGIRIERVMSYAHPVLQERAQIAQRAQTARVKIEGNDAAYPTLLELIESRMLVAGIDDTDIDWDARRLESGDWEVSSTWQNDDKMVTARWRYDLRNSIVHPGNKDTIEMVEPKRALAAVPTPVDDPSLDEDPTGPIPLVRDSAPAEPDRPRRPKRRAPERDVGLEQLFLDEEYDDAGDPGAGGNADRRPELREYDDELIEPATGEFELADEREYAEPPRGRGRSSRPEDAADTEPSDNTAGNDVDDSDEDAEAAPRSGGDKKPRIPSWDDIVFGVKRRK